MNDSPDDAPSETKAIQFEWTPELERIATSSGKIHPIIGSLELSDDYPFHTYQPHMALHDPADTRTCLWWIGLSTEKIDQVERKFAEKYPDSQDPQEDIQKSITRAE